MPRLRDVPRRVLDASGREICRCLFFELGARDAPLVLDGDTSDAARTGKPTSLPTAAPSGLVPPRRGVGSMQGAGKGVVGR